MDADKWLENPRLQPGQSSCASKLVCTNVEIMVYTKICNGFLDSKAKLTAEEVKSLESVIDRYRQVVDQRYDSLTEEESRVELQSRELLVVWSMFCIMHKTTNLEYSAILDAYSVALEMADLQHLVLFSKLAVDAVLTVAKYLRARSLKGPPIFSLRVLDKTFDLARRFARQSSNIMQMWEEEQSAANTRREDRWQVVLGKQNEVKKLRCLLHNQKIKLQNAEKELSGLTLPSGRTSTSSDEIFNAADKIVGSLKTQIMSTEQSIKSMTKPPPALLQPLPANEHEAMPILFFLQMPHHFQVLSRFSFMAQQLLRPRKSKIAHQTPETRWISYYAEHNGKYSPVTTCVELGSNNKLPSVEKLSGTDVMEYRSNIDGVWHPDSLLPCMLWNGGRFEPDTRHAPMYFDPFAKIDLHVSVDYFTETLSKRFSSMQWCMPVWSNKLDAMSKQMQLASRSRGNLALACQDIKPTWLNKTEFLSFGALRAYPHQQDRKVCVALHDRSLPLENVRFKSIPSVSYCLLFYDTNIYNLMLSLAFFVLSVY